MKNKFNLKKCEYDQTEKTSKSKITICIILIISLIAGISSICLKKSIEKKIELKVKEANVLINLSDSKENFESVSSSLKEIYESKNTEDAENSLDEFNQLRHLKDEIVNSISSYHALSSETVYNIESISSNYDAIINTFNDWRLYVINRTYLSDNPLESVSTHGSLISEYEGFLRFKLASLDAIKIKTNNKYQAYNTQATVFNILFYVSIVIFAVSVIVLLTKRNKK